MTKYTNPETSNEFQEISDERMEGDNPYDAYIVNKIELNNKYLMRNRPAVTKDLLGGSGNNLTGNNSRIGERPFTSINQISSFIQIPWYRNVRMDKLRIYMYCRVGDYNIESEGGTFSGECFIQAAFTSEINNVVNQDIENDGKIILLNSDADNGLQKIHPGEWQWIQFDYQPTKDGSIIDLPEAKWDVLQIGFGSMIPVSFLTGIDTVARSSAGREFAVKTSTDWFQWDTPSLSPELDSWQISGLSVSSYDLNLLSTSKISPAFMPAGTMVYDNGSSIEYRVMTLWPSDDIQVLPATINDSDTASYISKVSCPYIQVRSIHIQEIGSDAPSYQGEGRFKLRPERLTKNEVPYILSQKLSNITQRKECLVPFSKGYKARGGATWGGNQWTDRYQWLRHGVVKGGTGVSSLFQEMATAPKPITKVDFALIHTSYYNDLPDNDNKGRTTLGEGTVDNRDIVDLLNNGAEGYIKFIARVKQLNKTTGDFETVNSTTVYKQTKFMVLKDSVNWLSQDVFSNLIQTMLDTEYKEGFCFREGMMTMPGWGGNQGANDAFLLQAYDNNTFITVDVTGINQNLPILCELDVEIQTSNPYLPIQGGDVIDNRTESLTSTRLFTNLVGCSVWGY